MATFDPTMTTVPTDPVAGSATKLLTDTAAGPANGIVGAPAADAVRSTVPAILVVFVGLLLASWVVAGRALFGMAGELTQLYAFTLGLMIIVLHLFIGAGLAAAARRGHRLRPATIGMLVASWGCGILLGFMIPDVTPLGVQTIFSGPSEPALSIAIGVANPLGIIMLVTAIVALVLANGDAKGRPEPVEED